MSALSAYMLVPSSPSNSRARRWSIRIVAAMATVESFDRGSERFLRPAFEQNPLNLEYKIIVRSHSEALLSPGLTTDRDTFLIFDDAHSVFRWGLLLQGEQYRLLFTQWFDDLWASIPDTYQVHSRSGINQKALDLIRKELETAQSSRERRTA